MTPTPTPATPITAALTHNLARLPIINMDNLRLRLEAVRHPGRPPASSPVIPLSVSGLLLA